jgi:hypothetical protein
MAEAQSGRPAASNGYGARCADISANFKENQGFGADLPARPPVQLTKPVP